MWQVEPPNTLRQYHYLCLCYHSLLLCWWCWTYKVDLDLFFPDRSPTDVLNRSNRREQFGAGGGKVFCGVTTWDPVGILRTSANGVSIIISSTCCQSCCWRPNCFQGTRGAGLLVLDGGVHIVTSSHIGQQHCHVTDLEICRATERSSGSAQRRMWWEVVDQAVERGAR